MNYLAHLFLADAGPDPRSRVANLMGDFVRGPIDPAWPLWIQEGVRQHRRIDAYTDRHPMTLRSRQRLSPRRRRFAGIILDICYDHYLSVHWHRFTSRPREAFIGQCYRELEAHSVYLPAAMGAVVERMVAQDWLGAYQDPDAIIHSLDRVARRLSRPQRMLGAGEEFLQHYAELEQDFLRFFPDLRAWSANRP
jgi:acyl carrier protein phosphodiesterase